MRMWNRLITTAIIGATIALCGALGTETAGAHVPDDCAAQYDRVLEAFITLNQLSTDYVDATLDIDNTYYDLELFSRPLWQGAGGLLGSTFQFLDCLDPLFLQSLDQAR